MDRLVCRQCGIAIQDRRRMNLTHELVCLCRMCTQLYEINRWANFYYWLMSKWETRS